MHKTDKFTLPSANIFLVVSIETKTLIDLWPRPGLHEKIKKYSYLELGWLY